MKIKQNNNSIGEAGAHTASEKQTDTLPVASDERSSSVTKKVKTNLDVLHAVLEMSLGPAEAKEFSRTVMPMFHLSDFARQELSDEEYADALAKMQKELPYFLAYLRDAGAMHSRF